MLKVRLQDTPYAYAFVHHIYTPVSTVYIYKEREIGCMYTYTYIMHEAYMYIYILKYKYIYIYIYIYGVVSLIQLDCLWAVGCGP